MKRLSLKWSATLVCSTAVLLLSASVGNAGLIPWVWNGLFGAHCPQQRCPTPCDPCYTPSPCGPGGCGVQSTYFAPTAYASCSPCGSSCSPCGTSVCGVSGCDYGACGPAGCPSGNCGVSIPATNERTPEPSPPPAKTYEEGGADSETKANWNATDQDKAGPPNPGDEEEVKSFKPVPGKNAPVQTPSINEGGEKPEGATEKDAEKGADGGPDLLKQYLEEKHAWRPIVGRERLTRTPTYAKARIIRKPIHAKGEWKTVPSPANVAKR